MKPNEWQTELQLGKSIADLDNLSKKEDNKLLFWHQKSVLWRVSELLKHKSDNLTSSIASIEQLLWSKILNKYEKFRQENPNIIPDPNVFLDKIMKVDIKTWKTKLELIKWLQDGWILVWYNSKWEFLFADWWSKPRYLWEKLNYYQTRDRVHDNGYLLYTKELQISLEQFIKTLPDWNKVWQKRMWFWLESWDNPSWASYIELLPEMCLEIKGEDPLYSRDHIGAWCLLVV